jgi:peptidyl-prolyl cis-trans isomerase SurA
MELPENAGCLTLQQAMGIKAMVLQAEKDSLPVSDEEIETDIDNQIRYFMNAYGSREELERIAGKSIYQLREDYKEGFRDRKLASAMRSKIVENIKITPNEVKNYYISIPQDSLAYYESEVEVGQIVIFPKASREAEEYCLEQLNDYKRQIESGRDFKTIAALYSDDPGSKERGGMYEINRNQKDFDPIWLSKAFSLKEGQVSNPFKTRFGYHIMQLVSRSGDDAVVRHILRIPQVTQYEIKDGIEKLDTIRMKLIAGTIDFGSAVQRFSEDESSKFTAGLLQGREGGSFLALDELDKDLVLAIGKMKPGEYSRPEEFTNERGKKGVRIIHLKTRTDPHRENLKDDYNRVSQRALEQKKEAEIEKWFNSKINTYYIFVDEEYRSCDGMEKWLTKP